MSDRHHIALLWVLAPLVAACASAPAAEPGPPTPAVDPARAGVERLLERSEVESIVAARAPAFTRQVALLAEDLTDAELERLVPAVQNAFSATRLRDDVATFMLAEDPGGLVDAALAWLEGGANAELERIADGYEPPLSLEAFVEGLVEDPPERERIRLLLEWSEVQGAGAFYVLMEQALREAAHAVVAEFRPDARPFEPLSGEALFEVLEQSRNAAVVGFLHRLEPVSDDLLRRATEEYGSPSGQWYVESYSLAVARALRAGGQRTVATLRGSD